MPSKRWIVEIDCWPGSPRPDYYYKLAIEGLDEWLNKETSGRFMGDWSWTFETTEEDFLRLKPILFERLVAHYSDDHLQTRHGMRFLSVYEDERPPMPEEDGRVPVA